MFSKRNLPSIERKRHLVDKNLEEVAERRVHQVLFRGILEANTEHHGVLLGSGTELQFGWQDQSFLTTQFGEAMKWLPVNVRKELKFLLKLSSYLK